MSGAEYPVDAEKQQPACNSTGDSRFRTGSGTADDPYVVDWDLDDPDDPYNWPKVKRWIITAQVRPTAAT